MEGITVGDDVWIGAGAVLLDGVHVEPEQLLEQIH